MSENGSIRDTDEIVSETKNPEKKFTENPERQESTYFICGIDGTLVEGLDSKCPTCGLSQSEARYGNLFSKWKTTGSY